MWAERTPYVGNERVSLWAEQSAKAVRTNTEARDEPREGKLHQQLESLWKKGRLRIGCTGGNQSKVKYSGLEVSQEAQGHSKKIQVRQARSK